MPYETSNYRQTLCLKIHPWLGGNYVYRKAVWVMVPLIFEAAVFSKIYPIPTKKLFKADILKLEHFTMSGDQHTTSKFLHL